jgi:hypothetical protein
VVLSLGIAGVRVSRIRAFPRKSGVAQRGHKLAFGFGSKALPKEMPNSVCFFLHRLTVLPLFSLLPHQMDADALAGQAVEKAAAQQQEVEFTR